MWTVVLGDYLAYSVLEVVHIFLWNEGHMMIRIKYICNVFISEQLFSKHDLFTSQDETSLRE